MTQTKSQTTFRPIKVIAREIYKVWQNPYFGAKPYMEAMLSLETKNDWYYEDRGSYIVNYFLANASTFRGEDAKRLKAELKAAIK